MRHYILLKNSQTGRRGPDLYHETLRSTGPCQIHYLPVLQITAIQSELSPVKSTSYRAAVMTSANAVRYLPDHIRLSSFPVCYSIGAATTASIQARDPEAIVKTSPPPESAAALAGFIVNSQESGPVLFVCGDPHRPELTETLTNAGVQVDEMLAYRSRPRSDIAERFRALGLGSDDDVCIIAFSGEGGLAFVKHMGDDMESCRIVAIGRTTASAITKYYTGRVLVAKEATPSGVLHCLTQEIQTGR